MKHSSGKGKGLKTLHQCCQLLLLAKERPINIVLSELIVLIPDIWQYTEIVAARIVLAGAEFTTPGFERTSFSLSTSFETRQSIQGTIEVFFREIPTEEEEEKYIIDLVANMLHSCLNQKSDEEILKQMEAHQNAIINNANFLIWSVNREHKLTSFNKSFVDYVQNLHHVTPKLNTLFTDDNKAHTAVINKWGRRYDQALAGETFKVKFGTNDNIYEYSLSPITEDGQIIGVAILGEDISERIRLEQEMIDINKRLSETRLMTLRAFMNPHFVFNCMSSIQYYIMDNDRKSAVTYLSKFSKLIRGTLDNSVRSKVQLQETLEMIKLYVELESLRYENKFDFVLYVAPDIDIHAVEMPSLLIQPYIENAIAHGLHNKKTKGTLKVSFNQHGNNMLVEIEDDGVGRDAALQKKHEKPQKHKSMGMSLTEERLRLLNGENMPAVEITDLEKDGVPSGTRVKIWVKL